MRYIILPYKMYSNTAKMLAELLDAVRVRPDGLYRPREGDVIINWGHSSQPTWWGRMLNTSGIKILNLPVNVEIASNKLRALETLRDEGVPVPRFTTRREEAMDYAKVYCRTLLHASEGRGVTYLEHVDELPQALLYTEAIDIKAEYRLNVFNGEVISYAKKRRRNGFPATTLEQEKIRSYNNGWIFSHENLKHLDRVKAIAISAVGALGLDFGGVDIVMDEDGEVFVLECNTAVGAEGLTLEAYKNAIQNYATI